MEPNEKGKQATRKRSAEERDLSQKKMETSTVGGAVRVGAMAAIIMLTQVVAGWACPNITALPNFLQSPLVGASFTVDNSQVINMMPGVATYYFDSWSGENPMDGVPGLIEYCVYPSQPPGNPLPATPVAIGANGGPWTTTFHSVQGYFSFLRPDGNPSNIPLDGTTNYQMGTGSWAAAAGGAPSTQTILLHINDATECGRLYGGDPGTCFVKPSDNQTEPPPLCNGNPACKQVVIDEANPSTPLTVPAFTLLHIHYTYVIVNQPTNAFNMKFYPPTPKTQDLNSGGGKDYFGCEQIPDQLGAPGVAGTFANYQSTGFTMNLTVSKSTATCDQSRFTMTAPSPIVLAPGHSRTFTVDMITRVNKGGKQEYTSLGLHLLNSGFTVKWIQSDDGLLHNFSTNLTPIYVNAVAP